MKDVRDWVVCVVEPNKFEAQIIVDLLRNAGVEKVKVFLDSNAAMETLEHYPANIVIGSVESMPVDGPSWTRIFRRNHKLANRKAPIFLTSRAFSRNVAEDCRHAGANALIGKPLSGQTLIATIKKVLANPRPFIDAEGYVGPCRRAGIVTAGAPKKRRKADDAAKAGADMGSLAGLVVKLAKVTADYIRAAGDVAACEAALKPVQAYAVNAGDGPMMRACAAFALQLGAKNIRPDAAKAALTACIAGVSQLAELAVSEAAQREALAEQVRGAVARAALQKAA